MQSVRGRWLAALDGLAGWRCRGLLLALGALATLAQPPFHLWPLLFLALPGLVLLADRAGSPRAAFAAGWWFGFGHFIVGFYWIAHSMLTDPWRFGWMIPFTVGGLSAGMALLIGLALALSRLFWPPGPARLFALGAAWIFCEWLRSWVLSGFPWNLLAYSWAYSDNMIQLAAWTGSWGLSLVTVVACGAPALLLRWAPADRAPPPLRKPSLVALAGLAILGLVWGAGALRLAAAPAGEMPGLRLRLVQPALAPAIKNDQDRRAENLFLQLNLTTQSPGFERITHVIWPESAVPYLVERSDDVRQALARALPPGGLLIAGAVRAEPEIGAIERIWNSAFALDSNGNILATYDKARLVPYGEYVPLRELFPFIAKITPGAMDFTAGSGPQTLHLPGLPPVSPQICYEVIFPGRVADRADRPQWLLSLTNDAWFGTSTGPYQHFVSARFRAVEEGLPLVRSANAGISGFVDAYGRVIATLGLEKVGVLDGGLPLPAPSATAFARLGNGIMLALLAVAGILAALARRFLG
jgi:apolipoprotein N-acyltransferase